MNAAKGLLGLAMIGSLISSGSVAAQSRPVIATVISVSGRVEVKQGTANYRLAKPGETLARGDLMRAQRGARGVVRCRANASTWVVPDDSLPWGIANVCPSQTKRNAGNLGSLLSWLQDGLSW
jgi:hypothetical protein